MVTDGCQVLSETKKYVLGEKKRREENANGNSDG